jgi:hypothetical protein
MSGGLSVAKAIRVGSTLNVVGLSTLPSVSAGTIVVTSTSATAVAIGGGLQTTGAILVGGNLSVTGTSAFSIISTSGIITATNTTEATTTGTGSIVVAGGIGTAASVYVGKNLTVIQTSNFTGMATFNANVAISAPLTVTNTLDTTTAGTGCAVFSGGVNVVKSLLASGSLNVVGATNLSSSLQTNANIIHSGYQLTSPSSGTTLTIASNVPGVIISTGTSLASLTIAFPSAGSLTDGHTVFISTTQNITTVSTTGATFGVNMGFPSGLTGGQTLRYIFVSGTSTWYKI